ncbi:MAG: CPBP family intramembrane metalloprotease [Flavobacteriales bacterium]|nr:CPBP family intramembrane metalloprotease [Flavobacteriales bacterium]
MKRTWPFALSLLLWFCCCLWGHYNPNYFGQTDYTRSILRLLSLLIPITLVNRSADSRFMSLWKVNKGTIWMSAIILLVGIIAILHPTTDISRTYDLSGTIWLNWIFGSPILEEIFFRGTFLLRSRLKPIKKIVYSSILFSLFHSPQWIYMEYSSFWDVLSMQFIWFLFGLFFGVLAQISKSLLPSSIAHILNNYIAQIS